MNKTSPPACPNCERLELRVTELETKVTQMAETITKLTAELEEARRSGKRQAAPFRKKKKGSSYIVNAGIRFLHSQE